MAACCNTALVVQCIVKAYAKSASAAAVSRYQASLHSPHNALHSPSLTGFVHDYTLTVPATLEPGTCISINSACKINIKHMKHYMHYIRTCK